MDLKVVTEYKKNVPDIYRKIKDVIRKEVSDMTDLEVVEVNVTVVDIKTKEQQKDDEKVYKIVWLAQLKQQGNLHLIK